MGTQLDLRATAVIGNDQAAQEITISVIVIVVSVNYYSLLSNNGDNIVQH